MKTFKVNVDEKIYSFLDQLKSDLCKTTRADVLILALALLRVAADAHKNNQRLAITDGNNKVVKEIKLT